MSTISGKIDALQSVVDQNKELLDSLEKRLKLDLHMSEKERISVQNEYADLDEVIQNDELELKRLRGENRVSMLASVLIFAVIAVIYFSIYGPP